MTRHLFYLVEIDQLNTVKLAIYGKTIGITGREGSYEFCKAPFTVFREIRDRLVGRSDQYSKA